MAAVVVVVGGGGRGGEMFIGSDNGGDGVARQEGRGVK